MNITNDTKLEQWFNLLELSDNSRRLYLIYMQQFCDCVDKSPTELVNEAISEIRDGKLLSERNTVPYIVKFKKCLKDKGLAPKSQKSAMTAVKSFYKAFDIELSSAIRTFRKTLPLKENMSFLKKEDVQILITNAKSLRDKAIFLCMATSGMARNEIINLRFKDIQYDADGIGIVTVRRQKTQVDYMTFISPEAVQALKNYINERNRSDVLRVIGDKGFVFVTYDSGRQITQSTFTLIFKNLAKELGYTNGEFQIKSKSHALRKFFTSALTNAGMPFDKVDYMVGHAQSGIDIAYYPKFLEGLKALYLKYLPLLTFEKAIKVHSLDTEDAKRLETLKQENEILKLKVTELEKGRGEVDDLKNRMHEMELMLLKFMRGKEPSNTPANIKLRSRAEYDSEIDSEWKGKETPPKVLDEIKKTVDEQDKNDAEYKRRKNQNGRLKEMMEHE